MELSGYQSEWLYILGLLGAAHFADSRAIALEYWDAFCEATSL
ncbi:hypothetical protein [Allochromatium humboldtianum]|nr:hypothetical protein [Allochromatium humboldtianum]